MRWFFIGGRFYCLDNIFRFEARERNTWCVVAFFDTTHSDGDYGSPLEVVIKSGFDTEMDAQYCVREILLGKRDVDVKPSVVEVRDCKEQGFDVGVVMT